ncbi:MAG: hypothetical protein KDK05_29140 [Candidatus Competibacteraceae bacterium]|nr:hypothetical protein [Candidatus Competibacteraceae bacterium]
MKSNIYMHPFSAGSLCRTVLIQRSTGLQAVVDGRIVRLERPRPSAQSNFGQWPLRRKSR